MFFKTCIAAVGAAALFASTGAVPVVVGANASGDLLKRDSLISSGPELNITYSSNYTEHLPRTLILATGGTIAGVSSSETDSTAYTAGVVGIEQLVLAVPELLNVSNIDGMQVSNVGSESLTDEIALNLTKLVNTALCGSDAQYDAVVVTHGTDTLEETAFLLDAATQCDKPVVVVGAMRPSTAISADGSNNLLQAVTTAVSPNSRARGTLIVMNDRICQAFYCEKTEANTLDTFKAPEPGFIGGLLSDKPFYYYSVSVPTFKRVYDIGNVSALPHVEILYGYQGTDFELLDAAISSGAKGVVIAGTGAGSLTDAGIDNVIAAADQGLPIVRSTKINVGFTVPSSDSGYASTVASGFLNPVKSRRLLQILLALGKTQAEIKEAFEEPLQTYLTLDLSEYY